MNEVDDERDFERNAVNEIESDVKVPRSPLQRSNLLISTHERQFALNTTKRNGSSENRIGCLNGMTKEISI